MYTSFSAEEGLSDRGFEVTRLNTYNTVKSQTSSILLTYLFCCMHFIYVQYNYLFIPYG